MENIEAMLCGYIEGDLDDAARAQIEKHLQENPQHRKLIDDLLATREMVQSLPRVRAPMDVGDSLRGQVERSILLEDASVSAAPRETLSRLPHLMAIAAIFLLCAALCLIVYKALGPTFKPPIYTENTSVKAAVSSEGTVNASLSAAGPGPVGLVAGPNRVVAEPSLSAAPPAASQADESDITPETRGLPTQFDLQALRGRMAGSGYKLDSSGGVSPMVLVVQGDDLAAANEDVAQALSTAGVAWSRVPAAANPGLPVLVSGGSADQVTMQREIAAATTQQVAQLSSSNIELASRSEMANASIAGQAAVPATQPAVTNGLPINSSAVGSDVVDMLKGKNAGAVGGDVFVLRGITSDQVTQLRKSIAAADDVDALYVQDSIDMPATLPTRMTALPSAGPIGSSDKIAPQGSAGVAGAYGIAGGIGAGGDAAPATMPVPLTMNSTGDVLSAKTPSGTEDQAKEVNGSVAAGEVAGSPAPAKPLASVDAVIVVQASPADSDATTRAAALNPSSAGASPATTDPSPPDAAVPATQP